MSRDKGGLIGLTGVVFLVLLLAGAVIIGEAPNPDDNPREIVDFYVDNKGSIRVAVFLGPAALVALVFFGAFLRDVLRAAEGDRDFLPTVAFAGTLIIAIALATHSTLDLALAETANDIDPTATQALRALAYYNFIPITVGTIVFLSGLGLSVLRSGVLPKWMGWAALVLAVIGLTPLGFVAFIGALPLIAVISVMLAMRGRKAPVAG